MITLQMQGDVPESHWITIDIQRPDLARIAIILLFSFFQLTLEKLGKV